MPKCYPPKSVRLAAVAAALLSADRLCRSAISASVTGSASVSTGAVGDASGNFLYYTASSSANLTFNSNQPILVPISAVPGQNLN